MNSHITFTFRDACVDIQSRLLCFLAGTLDYRTGHGQVHLNFRSWTLIGSSQLRISREMSHADSLEIPNIHQYHHEYSRNGHFQGKVRSSSDTIAMASEVTAKTPDGFTFEARSYHILISFGSKSPLTRWLVGIPMPRRRQYKL